MTTLVTTNITSTAELNAWWAGIPANVVTPDEQHVALCAAGVIGGIPSLTGKTSNYGAVDQGYGTARIVITAASGVWVPNTTDKLTFDSTKGVVLDLAEWNASWDGQYGLEFRKLQLTSTSFNGGSAILNHDGRIESCIYSYGSKLLNTTVNFEARNSVFLTALVLNHASAKFYGCTFASLTDASPLILAGMYQYTVFIDCVSLNLAASPTVDPWPSLTQEYADAACSNNASNAAATTNIPGANKLLTTNAAFVAATTSLSTLDLKLVSGANLIGAGVADAAIPKDIFGNTRNSPPSIGSAEYLVNILNFVQTARFDNLQTFFGGTVSGTTASLTFVQTVTFQNPNTFFGGVFSKGAVYLRSAPLKSNLGFVRSNLLVEKIAILKLSDMSLVATFTNQTTDANGVLALTHPSLVLAEKYILVLANTTGTATGSETFEGTL